MQDAVFDSCQPPDEALRSVMVGLCALVWLGDGHTQAMYGRAHLSCEGTQHLRGVRVVVVVHKQVGDLQPSGVQPLQPVQKVLQITGFWRTGAAISTRGVASACGCASRSRTATTITPSSGYSVISLCAW